MRNRFAMYLMLLLSAGLPEARAQSASDAYFQLGFGGFADTFVIRLTDPAKIQIARNILSGSETELRHVLGTIVKAPSIYNAPWSYHFDVNSIGFFGFAVEVCDGSPRYVEEHLAEAGGAFPPGNVWCPWGSKLIKEVPPPAGADRSVTVVSAASFGELAIAPDSIATAFGTDLSPSNASAPSIPLPISLEGVSARLRDAAGVEQNAGLFAVARNQVNFLVPANAAPGVATVTVIAADGRIFTGSSYIQAVVPGVFAANLTRIRADGSREVRPIIEGSPVAFGPEGERLFLEIYATGLRKTDAGGLTVTAFDSLPVLYAGPQGGWPGLDQVTVELPRSLSGAGQVLFTMRAEAEPGPVQSNPLRVEFARP